MTEFYIGYNPYLVECVFKKNGNELREGKIGSKRKNHRLQALLGELSNWKGLIEEIDNSCDDDKVRVTFRGRKIDFDDLKYALNLYKGKNKFELQFEEAKNDSDISKELDEIMFDIKEKKYLNLRLRMIKEKIFSTHIVRQKMGFLR